MKGARRMKLYPVATSRGCPRHCEFCSVTPLFGRKMRHRDPKDVVDEIKRVSQRGMFIVDDNFTVDRRQVYEVLERMARLDSRPGWIAQAGVDVARDEDLLRLMKRAGCSCLAVGFESINDETLDAYGKGQTCDDVVNCIEKLHKHGIWVHGMFMLGGDADGPDAPDRTVAFAKKHKIDSVQFLAVTPVPGTDFYGRLEREGRIFSRDWSLYDGHHVVIEPLKMTPLELQLGLIRAHREFYSLRRVIREIRQFHWFAAFTTYYGHRLINKWRRGKSELLQILERRTHNRKRVTGAVSEGIPTGG
jgi:radical SAM superfamily enzyme YgiQ (UPF0313 family)